MTSTLVFLVTTVFERQLKSKSMIGYPVPLNAYGLYMIVNFARSICCPKPMKYCTGDDPNWVDAAGQRLTGNHEGICGKSTTGHCHICCKGSHTTCRQNEECCSGHCKKPYSLNPPKDLQGLCQQVCVRPFSYLLSWMSHSLNNKINRFMSMARQ